MKTIINTDTNKIFYGTLNEPLIGVEGYPYREATQEEIQAYEDEKLQEKNNQEARSFLSETDWKILRHVDQTSLGITTSLTQTEFDDLLQQRQDKRNLVI